ncbi:hypothetical protein AAA074_04860 [Coprococcus comes]
MKHTPYGYDIVDGKVVVNEEQAAQVTDLKMARLLLSVKIVRKSIKLRK